MTYQQKDDFIKKLERTALTTIVTSFITAFILSGSMFFYVKFQTEENKIQIMELRSQKADKSYVDQEKESNNKDHLAIKKGVDDLQKGQDRIFNFLLEHK